MYIDGEHQQYNWNYKVASLPKIINKNIILTPSILVTLYQATSRKKVRVNMYKQKQFYSNKAKFLITVDK